MKTETSENGFGFTCPFCKATLSISLANIKQWIRCPKCNRPIVPDDLDLKLHTTRSVDPSTENHSPGLVIHPSQASLSSIFAPSEVKPITSMKKLAIILVKSWLFIKAARLLLLQLLLGNAWYYPEDLAFLIVVMVMALFPQWFDSGHDI